LGFPDAELSVTLTSDAEIADLGGRFGRPARPTDVLSFSMLEGEASSFRGNALGDVVISVETAERQARERRVSLDRELRDLVIHGVLHVLGMDHERAEDARGMKALEEHVKWAIERLL
jgi:probable rRNA maturation factor